MNASYFMMNNRKVIFFRSYITEVLYIDGTTTCPYFSFLEYTGVTTQKQITTFLRCNLLDSIQNRDLLVKGYKAALKWARNKGYRGTRINVTCYPWYMVLGVAGKNDFYRVSYDGKQLKKIV